MNSSLITVSSSPFSNISRIIDINGTIPVPWQNHESISSSVCLADGSLRQVLSSQPDVQSSTPAPHKPNFSLPRTLSQAGSVRRAVLCPRMLYWRTKSAAEFQQEFRGLSDADLPYVLGGCLWISLNLNVRCVRYSYGRRDIYQLKLGVLVGGQL